MRLFFLVLLMLPGWLSAAPLRVISLSPHTTELAYAAGLGDNLVAASAYSDYPPQALDLERVANFRGLKLERIVALKPDLVLVWKSGNPEKEVHKLARLGINLFYSNPLSLGDIADNIERLGEWADDPQIARRAANNIRQELATLQKNLEGKEPVRYFYQLSSRPLMTSNGSHWPQPLFDLCGGENVFANSPVPYPQVSTEQVIMQQPAVVFYPHTEPRPTQRWESWADHLPALKNDAFFKVTAEWLNRPTPRALQAVTQICGALDNVRSDPSHTSKLKP